MPSPQLEEELFAAALAFPPDERLPFLGRACGQEPDLLARLQQLVRTASDSTEFVKEQSLTPSLHERVGNYHLLQELGEGSCGTVFLAEQIAPVRRQVALKIVKLSTDAKGVLARFEAERQALALMDHPSIAKVFDAGTTTSGQPYFAMEWIRGVKITEYCDLARLNIPERVQLFVQVCLATQHAHSQGVIHRDIKPSNVLVTLHDGEPVAKIIDFSIAKAISGRLTDRTLHTELGQFVGTPEYMSPEQLDPFGATADTRSDVYSLGALLYELLTGETPLARDELFSAGFEQMRTRIREHDPLRPSKRLSAVDRVQLRCASAQRRTPPAKLAQQLVGDLDWIVMRCVEKDVSRRYQTANELGLDLQRYLDHQPVLARPPTFVYTVRKFARRHRALVAAAGVCTAFIALLVAFAITTSLQNRRIAAERDRAERERLTTLQVSESMLSVIGTSDPIESGGRPTTTPALLDTIARDVQTDLNDDTEARARLLEAIGIAYRRIGRLEDAFRLQTEAVRIRKLLGISDGTLAETLMQLGITLRLQGHYDGSERTLDEAAAILHSIGQMRSVAYARLLRHRGRLQRSTGDVPAAERSVRESLALTTALLGPHDLETGVTWTELGQVLLWKDDAVSAEQSTRRALGILEGKLSPTHPDLALSYAGLADALYVQRRYGEAAPVFEKALSAYRQIFGERNLHTVYVLDSLAVLRLAQGQTEAAESLARQALAAYGSAYEADNPVASYYRITLAAALFAAHKYTEAEQELRAALKILTVKHKPNHQHTASAEHFLAEVLLATHRPAEAEATFKSSINRWKLSGAPAWRVARSENGLGQALFVQGRADEAERLLVDSYRILAVTQAADPMSQRNARERLVHFYTDRGERERLDAALTLPAGTSASLQ